MNRISNCGPFSGSGFRMENSKQNPHLSPLPKREPDTKICRACFSPLPLGKEAAKRQVRLLSVLMPVVVLVFGLASCETTNYAPPVTQQMVPKTSRKQTVDLAELERGRVLFVHRCIECHTLPPLWKYSREDWPKIVNDMSHRASLKSTDRDAIVAYILAVRDQM